MFVHSKLIRFALVGATVAGLYVTLYLALLWFGFPQLIANAVAFGLAVMFQYLAQAHFTFGQSLGDARQVLKFIIMVASGFITATVLTVLIGPQLGLKDGVSALMVTVILPFQNFLLMSLWVFSEASANPKETS